MLPNALKVFKQLVEPIMEAPHDPLDNEGSSDPSLN